jgi:hypothetical protein
MSCKHLQQLYTLCAAHDLKLSATDLIRVTCQQCGEVEVCPSVLTDEYDAKQQQESTEEDAEDATG